uniref:PtrProT4 n=1 Tax=Arundo donax TaxID=35708 RepID=A0A0A9EKI9_ARUDO
MRWRRRWRPAVTPSARSSTPAPSSSSSPKGHGCTAGTT